MKNVIEKHQEKWDNFQDKLSERAHIFNKLCNEIPDDWNVDGDLDSYCTMDIRFTGDKSRLQAMWKILRAAGLTPDEHVGTDVVSSFSTFWREPDKDSCIYMSWSSSVCKMVQRGTRTIEVPDYETVCNDTSAADVPVLSAE